MEIVEQEIEMAAETAPIAYKPKQSEPHCHSYLPFGTEAGNSRCCEGAMTDLDSVETASSTCTGVATSSIRMLSKTKPRVLTALIEEYQSEKDAEKGETQTEAPSSSKPTAGKVIEDLYTVSSSSEREEAEVDDSCSMTASITMRSESPSISDAAATRSTAFAASGDTGSSGGASLVSAIPQSDDLAEVESLSSTTAGGQVHIMRQQLSSLEQSVRGKTESYYTQGESLVGAIALSGPPPNISNIRASAPALMSATDPLAVVQHELNRFDEMVRNKMEGMGGFAHDPGAVTIGGDGVDSAAVASVAHIIVVNDEDLFTSSNDPQALMVAGDEEGSFGALMRLSGDSIAFGEEEDAAATPDAFSASCMVSLSSSHTVLEAELVEPDQSILVTAQEVKPWRSRKNGAVLVAILAIVALVAGLVVKFSVDETQNRQQQDQQRAEKDVRKKFEYDSRRLMENLGARLDLTMRAADAFMFSVISESHSSDAQWPLVTIPDLAVRSAKLLSQTKSMYMAFYPLITAEKRAEWENFTKYNDEWVEEGLLFQSRNPNFHGPLLERYSVSSLIWNNEGPENIKNPGPFMPSWMGSPIIPYYFPYNWNALAYEAFANPLMTAMNTRTAIFGPVSNHADPNDPVAVSHAAVTNDWAMPYVDKDEDSSEPFSELYYPVIETLDDFMLLDVASENGTAAKVLGSVAFSFYWRDVMKNLLSRDSNDLIVVFQNPCGNQHFTYKLKGTAAIFLGYGAPHDDQYGSLEVSSKLTDWLDNGHSGLLYTGLPANASFCPYTLTLYPSYNR